MQFAMDISDESKSYIRSLVLLQLETKLATMITEMAELGVQDMHRVSDVDQFSRTVVGV